MAGEVNGELKLRPLEEADLPALFEIRLDDEARHLAAFVTESARDRAAYLQKGRRLLADPAIITKVIEVDGDIAGSVGVFPMEGDLELTYWIRKDMWGRGVATAAVAALLQEVTTRPLHARGVEDNLGSVRVLERNGFVRVGSEDSFAEGRQTTVTELVYKL